VFYFHGAAWLRRRTDEAEEERQLELMNSAKKRVGHLLRSREQELQVRITPAG